MEKKENFASQKYEIIVQNLNLTGVTVVLNAQEKVQFLTVLTT